ncbi:MAG: tyrosine-type recombinase/integrase [Deltaproteobacteria bacterium]|nr:tyrosine-type recombinase/integrase [Deltaproteobacteria bacterium]
MVDQFFQRRHVQRRLQCSPLAGRLEDLVRRLAGRGYSTSTIQAYVQAAEHFGRWMQRTDRTAAEIRPEMVHAFLRHLPHCRCPPPRSHTLHVVRAALHQLLRGVPTSAVAASTLPNMTSLEGVLAAFDAHVRDACGLAPTTRHAYTRYARELLVDRYGAAPVDLAALTLPDVRAFVMARATRSTPGTANAIMTGVRSFLRYLQLQGLGDPHWPQALSRAAQWRLAALPRVLTDDQLRRFLAAFNQTTPLGRRDYALALCFTELGLRACEVAQLCLDDIDWRAGAMVIAAGKIRRATQLPLPARVAAALAEYLHHGRPAAATQRIFVQHRAPRGEPLGLPGVRSAIRYAYERAALKPMGTHVLRRTAATRLLRAGASMKEVADFLRHRSLDTSAIYAKVDVSALTGVALAWPEVR